VVWKDFDFYSAALTYLMTSSLHLTFEPRYPKNVWGS